MKKLFENKYTQVVVSICSLIKLKEKPILEEKQNRFMAII